MSQDLDAVVEGVSGSYSFQDFNVPWRLRAYNQREEREDVAALEALSRARPQDTTRRTCSQSQWGRIRVCRCLVDHTNVLASEGCGKKCRTAECRCAAPHLPRQRGIEMHPSVLRASQMHCFGVDPVSSGSVGLSEVTAKEHDGRWGRYRHEWQRTLA